MLPPGRAKLGTMPKRDRIADNCDERDCDRLRFEIEHHLVRDRKDRLRVVAQHVAGQARIVSGLRLGSATLTGESVNKKILTLDVAEQTKLFESRLLACATLCD